MVVSHQGHCISLTIRDGLPYMQMTKPTQSDIDRFEHVVFTSDDPSDPSSMNSELFLDAIDDTQPDPYDEYPEQCYHYAQHTTDGELDAHTSERRKEAKGMLPKQPDLDALRPYFNWISTERIQQTLKNTTQFFRAARQQRLKRHYKTRFPAANVSRINEDVATDTFTARSRHTMTEYQGTAGVRKFNYILGSHHT